MTPTKLSEALERIEVRLRHAVECIAGANREISVITHELSKEKPPAGPHDDAAAAILGEMIALGPRPDRQYSEPTDEDLERWKAWDSAFHELLTRWRAIGGSESRTEPPEGHVAKE